MALVNRGFLHYWDMKKLLKKSLSWKLQVRFFQECSLGNPFQKLFEKFLSIHKHDSGEWGLLALYGHEEIFKVVDP